jgi:hypothetical protein
MPTTYNEMLMKIKAMPELYIGKPSLTALMHFMKGYRTKGYEIGVGYDDSEDVDMQMYANSLYGLNLTAAKRCSTLILENTKDEEEAYHKYFEILEKWRMCTAQEKARMYKEKEIESHRNLMAEMPNFSKLLNYEKLINILSEGREHKILKLVSKMDFWLEIPMSEQEAAIENLVAVIDTDDCDLVILAGNKGTWINTVKALKIIGYPKNKKALPSLIYLLRDLNWPGAEEGMDILKEADRSEVLPILEVAITDAYNTKDDCWLLFIRTFLNFAEISKADFPNPDIYDLLKYADTDEISFPF